MLEEELVRGGLFIGAVLVVGLLGWLVFRKAKVQVCKSCGHVGLPSSVTPGSLILEIFLWLMFIVPGIIYSLFRLSQRHPACSNCKSREIIPTDSPIAAKFMQQNGLFPKNGVKEAPVLSNWPPKAINQKED